MTFIDNIESHRSLQNLAFEVVREVQGQLKCGLSEEDASNMLEQSFQKRGISKFFHRPFAWFGKRTGFMDFSRPLSVDKKGLHLGKEFFPRPDVKLEINMPVILDVAPVTKDATVDIGHSFAFGDFPPMLEVQHVLDDLRMIIPSLFERDLTINEIYIEVDKIISRNNYTNIHSLYPKGVLGHRIGKLPLATIPSPNIARFSIQAYLYLMQPSPLIAKGINDKPKEGIWAIEPHLRGENFGAKFEELLLFKDGKATWLRDQT